MTNPDPNCMTSATATGVRPVSAATRYHAVNDAWNLARKPAVTRVEAERAQRALIRKFGKAREYPAQRYDVRPWPVRRCWISAKNNPGSDKGWERLVHDVSHHIFRKRYPSFRPHHPMHARLELEITMHVLTSGWLDGALKPKPKLRPSSEERRTTKIVRIDASLARWDSKRRRAETAIQKLERQRRALTRRLQPTETQCSTN